jgi:hypothetical protein
MSGILQSDILMCLLESRNIVQRSHYNIQKLQLAGFCGKYISVLVEKSDRFGVAHLCRIDADKVLELFKSFESTLSTFESLGMHKIQRFAQSQDTINTSLTDNTLELNALCMDILTSIGLQSASNAPGLIIWQRVTQVIDFAILCYVGAHIERFDKKFLNTEISCLQLPNLGLYSYDVFDEQAKGGSWDFEGQGHTEKRVKSNWPPVIVSRRSLQCLDRFLGGMHIWVFHQGHEVQLDQRLCLSADIETLTDVWGPSWKILRTSSPGHIERLDIGNGSIMPWASDPDLDLDLGAPNPDAGEVYCHWIPRKKWNSEFIKQHQAGLERKHFLDTDRLLIGARERGLLVNNDCKLTVACLRNIKSTLLDESALQRPGTDRPRRYVDSYALQVQGSILSAVSGAATVTYKRRNGQNMKDTLVERWRNTKNRNPGELEAFCGIEVSLCTQNARRRRLLDLLNSTTMRKYLKGKRSSLKPRIRLIFST